MAVEVGDPVYRRALESHRQWLPPSESGGYCVVVEDGDGDRLYAVYGPYGTDKAVDVAASLDSQHADRTPEDQVLVSVVPWCSDDPS